MQPNVDQLSYLFSNLPYLWYVVAAFALVVVCVAVIFVSRIKRIKTYAPVALAVFPVMAILAIMLNVLVYVNDSDDLPLRRFIWKDKPSLFINCLETPYNGYIFGNEPYLFLNDYLREKQLIVAKKGKSLRFFRRARNGLVRPARTKNELVFSDVLKRDYRDTLSESRLKRLMAEPFYGVGIPNVNYAVFIMGVAYEKSSKIYLLTRDSSYYFVPACLLGFDG